MDEPVIGYEELRVEALNDIGKDEFAEFCRALLAAEVMDRHAPDVEVRGPLQPDTRDGGIDLRVIVRSTPDLSDKEYFRKYGFCFTHERPGTTVFSCKTSKAAKGLRDLLIKDATRKGRDVVEALLNGARFTIVVNRPLDPDQLTPRKKTSLRQEIAGALWSRMREQRADAEDPTERITFVDAQLLLDFLKTRKPTLPERFRKKLGLELRGKLMSVEAWRRHHDLDRPDAPGYTPDPSRSEVVLKLREALSGADADVYRRIAWLYGPPGVGKTRLAIEVLDGDVALRERALVTIDALDAFDLVRERGLLSRRPDTLLVADDCPADRAEGLINDFVRIAGKDSRSALLILTPCAISLAPTFVTEQTMKRLSRAFPLEPMEEAAQRTLIESVSEGAADPAVVDRIIRLTRGFPWFSVLVARGVREDPSTLPEGATMDQAVDLALVSPHEAPPGAERRRLILNRERCLLAAMLTESEDWSTLSEEEQSGLSLAVGAKSWSELSDTHAPECVERGILRMSLGRRYKYVTPVILAREVARRLLHPPPQGPEPRGRHIRRHAGRFITGFYEVLERLELDAKRDADLFAELAADVVDELRSRPRDLDALRDGAVPGSALRFAAEHLPAPVASLLRAIIDATSLDALRAAEDIRRDLVFALSSMARRRASFEDAEPALFRLACAENEIYGNNATAEWTQLFLIELNPTYRRFEERLPILRARCVEGDLPSRRVALGGLASALAVQTTRDGDEQRDGPYATPTRSEARQARRLAWDLLAELAGDPQPEIAEAARAMMIEHLRAAVWAGLAAEGAGRVAAALPGFAELELRRLREVIAAVDAHDGPRLAASPEGSAAWADLAAKAAPRSYRERLRQVVGTYGVERRGADAEALDEALAIEGLSQPSLIVDELEWLESREAARAMLFLKAAGRVDDHRYLLQPLLDRARLPERGGADSLAAYLDGWKHAGREAEVDELLRGLRSDPRFSDAIALSVRRLGATDERIGWILEDLRVGRLSEGVVGALGWGSWEQHASSAALRSLVEALLVRRTWSSSATALNLIVHRMQEEAPPLLGWIDPLRRALEDLADEKLSGVAEHLWKEGGKLLARQGDVDGVMTLVLKAMKARGKRWGSFGWEVIAACAQIDAKVTWRALARVLEAGEDDPKRNHELALDMWYFGPGEALPAEDVLEWVGTNPARAAIIAEMCDVHRDELSTLARGLLLRFGPDSRAARELRAHVHSTKRAVTSLAELTAKQLGRARVWARDPDPGIRRWAEALIESLQESHESYAASEEYERRRWGT